MYRLQAKVAKLVLALASVASGAELGTNDRGLSNASDEVQGLFVRESNASTVCGVGSPVDVRGCARVAVTSGSAAGGDRLGSGTGSSSPRTARR